MTRKRVIYVVIGVLVIIVLFVAYMALGLPGSDRVLMTVMDQVIKCETLPEMSLRVEETGIPGVSGAPRWGLVEASETVRVRKSWSTLTDEEKQQFVDGILLMKATKVNSDMAGANRADYVSLCPSGQSYERSLMDYYAELHMSAFKTMGGYPMETMAHKAPHFLPWHRYMLLRFEADMQQVLDDPTFTLPYWDWDDCEAGKEDGSNPCPLIFEDEFLGSFGGAEGEDEVKGYLVDQGYEVNIWAEDNLNTLLNTDGVVCGARPLSRSVGYNTLILEEFKNQPPKSAESIEQAYQIPTYDAEPYDACSTDATESFRQFIEGFRANDPFPCYTDGRCAPTHGLGHVYIGGDMENAGTPNDPMFFLHHANVDRIWAMWQDHNRQNENTSIDYGNPGFPDMWRTYLFNYPDVQVEELFNFRDLGYSYDSNEAEYGS